MKRPKDPRKNCPRWYKDVPKWFEDYPKAHKYVIEWSKDNLK